MDQAFNRSGTLIYCQPCSMMPDLALQAVFDDTRAAIYRALQGRPASQQEVQGLVSSSNSFQAAKFQYELATDRDRIDALTAQNAQLAKLTEQWPHWDAGKGRRYW